MSCSTREAWTWERLPVDDEYDEDGRRAIFVDDHVIVVSELAVVILDRLPADEKEIAAALVERFGEPPQEAAGLVASALETLASQRLVNSVCTGR